MNLSQTKLVGLTMELDLKAREYNELCDKLERVKQSNIKSEDGRLLELKKLFQKNHDEIIEINKQIKELKETEEYIEKQKLEKYDTTNLFKTKSTDSSKNKEEENLNISVVKTKKSIFESLIKKIKKFFSKKFF